MIWIAPTEKDTAMATLEKRLWDAADQFRAKKCEVQSVRHSTFRIREQMRVSTAASIKAA